MYRYLAFLWNDRDPRASAVAEDLGNQIERSRNSREWRTAFRSRGMRVYGQSPRTSDMKEYALPARYGVILGRLFPAELGSMEAGWNPAIEAKDAAQFLASRGRALTEAYWGAYVAFLHSSTAHHTVVLRDPSGKLPCFRLRHADVDVIFSDVTDLSTLRLPRFALNPRYLAAFIFRNSLQVRETAISGITEILAGEGYELHGRRHQQITVWDPASVAAAPEHRPYEQAAATLRHVTQACIDAWACVHPRILHFLSGGLDSSIVLGCLARSRHPASILCVNHYLDVAEGDERRYARQAAQLAGVPLIERPLLAAEFIYDSSLLQLPRSPRPCFSQCDRWKQLHAVNAVAEGHYADAVWTGQGGDHLFLKSKDVASAADNLVDLGFGVGLAHAVLDEAHVSRRPYLLVLRSALAARWSRTRCSIRPVDQPCHFVRRDALPVDLEHYLSNPSVIAAEALPPGRQLQVALVAEVTNRHRPIPGAEFAYQHHPLLSQPIVEACLRAPTYTHLWGGRPRALARHAFADRVPAEIIQREDKGNTTSLIVEGIRRSAPFLCELLLDGVLVHERLVERAELVRCLREGRALQGRELPALAACIAAEIWARAWRPDATSTACSGPS